MKKFAGKIVIVGVAIITMGSFVCFGLREQEAEAVQTSSWDVDDISQTGVKGEEPAEPGQIYADAFETLIGANSYEAEVNIDISRVDEADGTMNMNLKVNNSDYAPEYMMGIEDTIFGEPYSHSEMFYTNGFEHSIHYRDVRPEDYSKIKTKMEPDEARKYFTSIIDGIVLAPEYLTDFQLISVTDKKQCLTFRGKPELFKSIAANISDSTMAYYLVVQELNIKALSGVAEIDSNGNLLKFELNIEVFQRDVLCDMKMQVEYVNPGQPCLFSLPASAEYIEFITVEEPADDLINEAERQAVSEIEEPDDLRQIYTDAVRKTSNLDSYEAAIYVRNEDRRGNKLVGDMDTAIDVKVQNKNSPDAKCLLNIWNDESGSDSTYDTVFYTNGLAYHRYISGEWDLPNEKKVALKQVMAEFIDPMAGVVWNPNYLTDISVIDEADGSRTVTFNVTKEGARQMVQQVTRLHLRMGYINVPEGEVSGSAIIDSDGYMTESEVLIKEREVGAWFIRTSFYNPGQAVDFGNLTVEEYKEKSVEDYLRKEPLPTAKVPVISAGETMYEKYSKPTDFDSIAALAIEPIHEEEGVFGGSPVIWTTINDGKFLHFYYSFTYPEKCPPEYAGNVIIGEDIPLSCGIQVGMTSIEAEAIMPGWYRFKWESPDYISGLDWNSNTYPDHWCRQFPQILIAKIDDGNEMPCTIGLFLDEQGIVRAIAFNYPTAG